MVKLEKPSNHNKNISGFNNNARFFPRFLKFFRIPVKIFPFLEDKTNKEVVNMVNKPIMKWRSGNIDVAVWENKKKIDDKEEITFRTVSLSRSYKKQGEDIWRSEVINLRRNDLPKVHLVINKAMDYLYLQQKTAEKEEEDDE